MAEAREGSSPGGTQATPAGSAAPPARAVRWADVWTRAVIGPAWRRASAIWVGCAIIAAVLFGPTAMMPSDLTWLALHDPGVGAVLAATWILVYAPTARLIVRADGAAYLRALPGPRGAPLAIGGAAFVVLQLPWLALWVIGEGARGLAVVGAVSLVTLLLARWRPPPVRARWPGWRSAASALRRIQLRALRRRAGDALVRGIGLALLAGVAGGLFVRNNDLAGTEAAAFGAAVIAVALVPAYVGVLLVLLGAHRETAWLAESLGVPRSTRIAAIVFGVGVVQLAGSALALGAVAIVAEPSGETLLWLGVTMLGVAVGATLGCTRALLVSERSPTVAARTAIGAFAVAAAAVLCLGLFGVPGVLAYDAAGALALGTVRA